MKYFKLRSAICALGLFANTAFAADTDTDHSSVWKVSKGEDKIYVGGTIHILPITEFPLPSQFMQAYEQSDTVILEAKLPDPTDAAAQQKMMAAAAYEEGKSLKDAVSPETYAALEEYFAPFGAKVEKLAKLTLSQARSQAGMVPLSHQVTGNHASFRQMPTKVVNMSPGDIFSNT